MAQTSCINVYKGPDAVRQYFDPDSMPPLLLVELPECINPYRRDGVHIYAKMMTIHPANNIKCMPAMNLLEKSVVPGKTKTIVEYSSGSTVISMSLVDRAIYGISDTRAFLSNKTSNTKLKLMKFFGLDLIVKEAEDIINPNQYDNDDNWRSHIRWTGPQIMKQLPEINLICAGIGTSVTETSVCTAAGDRVPGPRSYTLLAPVEFPWQESTDHIEHVGSYDSYSLSLDLCRQGIICGPSSGFNPKGLFQYIEKCKTNGSLANLAGPDGEIHCVFLCCDLPYQYIDEYYEKLEDERFRPIKNEELTKVDKYPYDEAWERDCSDALRDFFEVKDLFSLICSIRAFINLSLEDILAPKVGISIIDLRQPSDFAANSLPGSTNLSIALPTAAILFSEPAVMTANLLRLVQNKRILLLCHDGDSARVATSVLRAKG
ncbi:tryptophan synthase beta subunit-like PLP-dependent enzyme [Xylariaceae sp. FL1651]|nr:tryptophan synthase beta subunit-like PLP-dependent enzyme [Xylariaceae sp. FL1651]